GTAKEQTDISEKIGFIFKDNPQERREQIQSLLGEINKELNEPGTGSLPKIVYIGDYPADIERFTALLSDALHQLCGFKGQLKSGLSIEEQLKAQGLSLKTMRGAIYLNGDILDRGPYGIKSFNIVKELLETAPDRVFYVSGNHDFWTFGNLLGMHLPWYKGFNFYGDKEAEALIAQYRKTESVLFDSFPAFLYWTERLAEFNDEQNKFQKEFLEGKAEEIRKKFIEHYDKYNKQWSKTQLDSMEDFIGYFKRIDVPNPYVGLKGMGKTSNIWWKNLLEQLIQGHEARREAGAEDEELAIWQEAVSLASQIQLEVERRLKQALSSGKLWYRIFESINTQAYVSVEWWCKDWSSHKGWGERAIKELNETNSTKLTQKNYITSPTLIALANFYRSNFNLYIKNPYGGLMSHGWFPVEDDGNIVISYKGKSYTQKDIFEGLNVISADIKNRKKSLYEIWEAMHLVNSFYADKVTRIKPTHVRQYIKMGIAKIQSRLGVPQWFTGHNVLAKLKIPFMVKDADFVHFNIDKGMAGSFGGEGTYILMGPMGIILRGFEAKDSTNIVTSPKTIIDDKKKPGPTIIENPGMSAEEFLTTTKSFLEKELLDLNSRNLTAIKGSGARSSSAARNKSVAKFKIGEAVNADRLDRQRSLLKSSSMDELCDSIDQSLLSGEKIDRHVFNRAFEFLLNNYTGQSEYGQVTRGVLQYYDGIYGSGERLDKLYKQIKRIREILYKFPYFNMVYGTGFPHYGLVDLKRRMFFTLMDFKRGKLQAYHTAKRMIPDYDFVIVFSIPGKKRWPISPDSPEVYKQAFIDFLEKNNQWSKLMEEFGKIGISEFNIRFRRKDYKRYISSFQQENKLVVDIGYFPTPLAVWRNVPVLVGDEDHRIAGIIRDLWLSEDIGVVKPEDGVISNYRKNLILCQLLNSPMSESQLVNIIAQKRNRLEVHAPVLKIYPIVRRQFYKLWASYIHMAVRQGLVCRSGELFKITPLGRAYMDRVLTWRSTLLSRGYFDDKYFDCMKALEELNRDAAVSIINRKSSVG
ncbi:MAG: metallophosphoesterase, partial [Candidatus Omnitrophica bacterium]|nr:metallophosphoesterase [Candidatus Omnitrophota bacterium]